MAADIGHLDLNAAASRGIKVEILHPQTKQKLFDDSFIRVLGSDSEEWKKADRRINGERKNPTAPMSKAEHDDHVLKVLAAVTQEVSGIIINGTTYTKESAYDLYTLVGFHWIYEQVLIKANSRLELDLGKKDSASG